MEHGTTSTYTHHKCRCDECRDANRIVQNAWRHNNPDKKSTNDARWRQQNPERKRIASQRWRETHRDHLRHADSLRRATYKETDITVEWLSALRTSTTICILCDEELLRPHLDHIVPLGVGGRHIKDNVRFVCDKCNLRRPKDGSDLR
jgi:hypothetical protein